MTWMGVKLQMDMQRQGWMEFEPGDENLLASGDSC